MSIPQLSLLPSATGFRYAIFLFRLYLFYFYCIRRTPPTSGGVNYKNKFGRTTLGQLQRSDHHFAAMRSVAPPQLLPEVGAQSTLGPLKRSDHQHAAMRPVAPPQLLP